MYPSDLSIIYCYQKCRCNPHDFESSSRTTDTKMWRKCFVSRDVDYAGLTASSKQEESLENVVFVQTTKIHRIRMEFNHFYKSQKKYHKVVNVHLDCLFPGVLTLWMSSVINLRMRLQRIHQWM